MVKSFITVIVTFLILVGGAVYEQIYIGKAFSGLKEEFTEIYEKIDDESITNEEILSAQEKWIEEKHKLHAFIPHNEIKELDLWIAEAVYYVEVQNYEEAQGKVSVAIELLEQIPRTFAVTFENVF